MGRPRKYKRPQIRRKCHYCGKFSNQPYVVHKVPSIGILDIIPYSTKSIKTSRVELKGGMKVEAKHYCNQDCHASASGGMHG